MKDEQLKEKFLKDKKNKFLNNIEILKNNNIINFSFRRIFTLIQINNLDVVIYQLGENTKFFLENVPVDEIKNLSNKSVDDIVKFVLEYKNSVNNTTKINLVQTAELIEINKPREQNSDKNQTNKPEELVDDIVIIGKDEIPSQEIKTTSWFNYFNPFVSRY